MSFISDCRNNVKNHMNSNANKPDEIIFIGL